MAKRVGCIFMTDLLNILPQQKFIWNIVTTTIVPVTNPFETKQWNKICYQQRLPFQIEIFQLPKKWCYLLLLWIKCPTLFWQTSLLNWKMGAYNEKLLSIWMNEMVQTQNILTPIHLHAKQLLCSTHCWRQHPEQIIILRWCHIVAKLMSYPESLLTHTHMWPCDMYLMLHILKHE